MYNYLPPQGLGVKVTLVNIIGENGSHGQLEETVCHERLADETPP